MKHIQKLRKLILTLGILAGMSLTAYANASVPYKVAQVNATTHAITFSDRQCSSYIAVTDSNEAVTWNSGWYVVPEGNVTVNARITVNGEVNLILSDGANFNPEAGITVAENNTLNIYAQSKGNHMGKIYVSGGDQYAGIKNPSHKSAGIGGENEQSGGTVTIHGGTITVTGGPGGAGIGGGWHGNGGVLTVYGGNITATGGQTSAGIGGGSGYYEGNHVNGNGGEVKIYGGTVTATGGYESMGIGMGYYGSENGSLTLGEGVQLYGGNSQDAQSEVTLSNNDYARYKYMKTVAETTTDVSGVELNKSSVALTVGKTETLTATVSPDDATDKTVTWSSDNTAVATVSDGVVTAQDIGTATITVTATNGTDDTSDDKTATCTVTVVPSIVVVTAKADPYNTGTYYATFYDSTTSYTADCEVYYATANADGRLTLEKAEGNVIKAGEGVILKATSETVTLTPTTTEANYDSLLTGSDSETTVENALVLSLGKNGVWFYKYSGTLGANKAYLAQ